MPLRLSRTTAHASERLNLPYRILDLSNPISLPRPNTVRQNAFRSRGIGEPIGASHDIWPTCIAQETVKDALVSRGPATSKGPLPDRPSGAGGSDTATGRGVQGPVRPASGDLAAGAGLKRSPLPEHRTSVHLRSRRDLMVQEGAGGSTCPQQPSSGSDKMAAH